MCACVSNVENFNNIFTEIPNFFVDTGDNLLYIRNYLINLSGLSLAYVLIISMTRIKLIFNPGNP